MSFLPSTGGSLNPTRVDASAGVFTETLPAATGSEASILYTLVDKTNAASLSVQSGEEVNNIVDGTFDFTQYPVGTQFLATDRATGEWDVAVVGASDNVETEFITAAVNEVVGISGATFLYNGSPGTGQVSINGVTYYDEGQFRYIQIEMDVFDDSLQVY